MVSRGNFIGVVERLNKLKVVIIKSESFSVIVFKCGLFKRVFTVQYETTIDIRVRDGIVGVISMVGRIAGILESPYKHFDGVIE